MLILKQNAANTVPTPPAGKGTIFLDDSDTLSVKTSDGNVETFPTVGASNAQVVFMNGTTLSGEADFTYNFNTNVLTVTGNVAAGNVKTDNLLYANGVAWDLQQPGGSNTQVQFNDADSFGGSANYVFNKTTNNLTVTGNIINSSGAFYGSGAGLTSVPGANVSGAVAYATTANAVAGANVSGTVSSATTAGTVTTAAQPNITSVGTLSSLSVTGNISAGNVSATTFTGALSGAATTAGTVTTAAQPNITSVGTLSGLTVSSTITGSVSGSAGTAGTVTTAAQPNITSVGSLTSLTVTGNANVGNLGTAGLVVATGNITGGNLVTSGALSVTGNANVGNIGATLFVGTLATASQPNITSVGTLTSLAVTGNASAGNLSTAGVLTVSGTSQSSIAGNLTMNSKNIVSLADPVNAQDAATKNYVDTVVQGLHVHDSVYVGTTGTLATASGGTVSYNNGSSGVGATLTTTGTYLLIDGANVQTAGTRIMVKNEANAAWNGIYTYTNTTTLTRATDFDTSAEAAGGDFFFITSGSTQADTGWVQTTDNPTIGTSNIVFTQFSGAGTYTAGTGLTLTGTQFSITNTAVTSGSYGNGDRVASFTVNSQGQLTAASNVVIAANAANLTGTTLNSSIVTSSLTAVGTVTTGIWNNNIGSSATFAAGLSGANLASITGANVTGTVPAATVAGTVTTAAQPNITSVGTLTSLGVNGTVTAVAFTANSGVFTGNGSGLSAIAGANVSGTVSSATTAGTVTTAAQPNITSTGTLTSLTVSGNITAQSSLVMTNNIIHSVATGITAAGTVQANATAITKDFNVVSTVSSGTGVVLPTAVAGMRITVLNTGGNALLVYPASGGTINSLASNAGFSEAAGARLDFIATSSTQWYTLNATYA